MMASVANNLASLLIRTAHCWPRLPAVASGDHVLLDYRSLAERVAGLAGALRKAGLQTGDRIAIVSRNAPAYIETLFACWWAGLVAVPANAKLHPKELAFVLGNSGARWALVDDEWQLALSATASATADLQRVMALGGREYEQCVASGEPMAPVPVADTTPAWLFYTSGTTGLPKGVVISHGNLRAMAQCFLSDVEAIAPGDALLHPAPLSHGSGLYVVPHVARGAVNVIPESGGFDPTEVAALLERWQRTLFFAAPTMVKRFVTAPALASARLDHLKCIVYGGGPMYIEDCKLAFAALGPRLAQIYARASHR
jgi:long-chain acyl-CoA synthetase